MFRVTRFDGSELVVNAGHLLLVEHTPDTVLVLTTGHRLMVKESIDEVIRRVEAYRRSIAHPVKPLESVESLQELASDSAELAPLEESET